MKESEFNFTYDREADVLYVFKGKPCRSKTAEIGEDFILRLDPKTGEVIGLTIIDFSRHFPVFGSGGKRRFPERGSFSPEAFLAGVTAATRWIAGSIPIDRTSIEQSAKCPSG